MVHHGNHVQELEDSVLCNLLEHSICITVVVHFLLGGHLCLFQP